jgi:hypothetical protein
VLKLVRDACQARGQEIVDRLFQIANDKGQSTYGRVAALRTLAAYAWGSPVSMAAVHLLDHRRDNGDGQEVAVTIAFVGKDGQPATLDLDAYAAQATQSPELKPAPMIEDLRPASMAATKETREVARARLRAELEANEREIERLRTLIGERQTGFLMDLPPGSDYQ